MRTRMLTIGVLAFGLVLTLGASCEIILAVNPWILPPEATAVPFMAAHQTSWFLRGWVLGSNAVNLVCALAITTAAVAIRRGQAHGWRRLRRATAVLGTVALLGVPVCLWYLLPLPEGPAASDSRFMLVSVIGASAGLAAVCVVLFRRATRELSPP